MCMAELYIPVVGIVSRCTGATAMLEEMSAANIQCLMILKVVSQCFCSGLDQSFQKCMNKVTCLA